MVFLGQIVIRIMHLITRLLKEVLNVWPKSLVRYASTNLQQAKLKEIGKEFEKYDGGSVDLEMDEETGIAVMTLNNPSTLNSVTGKMIVDLESKITMLENWSGGKGLILMGKGGNLCSGGDLTFVRKILHLGSEMAMYQQNNLTRLLNLPLVSVALIQGHTVGGGAELSTACDFRVMSSKAKIGFIHAKMGLTTGWGATTRLIQLLGRQKTLSLLLNAKVLNAQEASDCHIVDHILQPSSSLEEEFSECRSWLLSNYCRYDPDLTQSVKSSVVFCDANRDVETSLGEERKVFAKFWGGPGQKSALAANKKHR